MLTWKETKNYITTFIKEIEKLMYKIAFLSLPKIDQYKLVVTLEVAHQIITKDVIYKALISQSIFKVPGPKKINFCILCMVLDWDNKKIMAIV